MLVAVIFSQQEIGSRVTNELLDMWSAFSMGEIAIIVFSDNPGL